MKRLYFIAATDANGENVDLFVAALSVPDAIIAWQAYYEASGFDDLDEEPERVFEVPDISGMILDTWNPATPLSWHGDLKQVGGKLENHTD